MHDEQTPQNVCREASHHVCAPPDPDLEIRGGGRAVPPIFFFGPSGFSLKIRGGGPPGPLPRSATDVDGDAEYAFCWRDGSVL